MRKRINNRFTINSWQRGREGGRRAIDQKIQISMPCKVKGRFCSLLEVMTSKKQFHSCALRSLLIVCNAPRQNSPSDLEKKKKKTEKEGEREREKKMNKEYA